MYKRAKLINLPLSVLRRGTFSLFSLQLSPTPMVTTSLLSAPVSSIDPQLCPLTREEKWGMCPGLASFTSGSVVTGDRISLFSKSGWYSIVQILPNVSVNWLVDTWVDSIAWLVQNAAINMACSHPFNTPTSNILGKYTEVPRRRGWGRSRGNTTSGGFLFFSLLLLFLFENEFTSLCFKFWYVKGRANRIRPRDPASPWGLLDVLRYRRADSPSWSRAPLASVRDAHSFLKHTALEASLSFPWAHQPSTWQAGRLPFREELQRALQSEDPAGLGMLCKAQVRLSCPSLYVSIFPCVWKTPSL